MSWTIRALVMGVAVSACADGTAADNGATNHAPGSTYPTFGAGICVPQTTLPTSMHTLSAQCTPSTYGGRATAIGATLLAGVAQVRVVDTGNLPAAGGDLDGELLHANVDNAVVADAAFASVNGGKSETHATAEITAAGIDVLGIKIGADVLGSASDAKCVNGTAAYSGGSTITNLSIDGIKVDANAAPNTTIGVRGILTVTVNEQKMTAQGFTVSALHVKALSPLQAVDIVIARSNALLNCGCAERPPPDGGTSSSSSSGGSSSGGSSSGGDPDGGTSSSSSSSGGSSSGGSSSGGSSSGGSSSGGSSSGGSSSGGSSSGGSSSGGSSSGGSSSGGSSSGGSSSGGSSSGGSSSGGSSSGGSSSGGSSDGGVDIRVNGGGLGASCDDSNPCATGFACADAEAAVN